MFDVSASDEREGYMGPWYQERGPIFSKNEKRSVKTDSLAQMFFQLSLQ